LSLKLRSLYALIYNISSQYTSLFVSGDESFTFANTI